MLASPSPSLSGSAPADPTTLTPSKILELKTAALEALDCQGQFRTDLETAIDLMVTEDYHPGLRMISDHGCARGAEAASGFWRQRSKHAITRTSDHVSLAFLRLMKTYQAALESRDGNILRGDLITSAAQALAVHGDVRMDVRSF